MSYTPAGDAAESTQTDAPDAAREDALDAVFTVLSDQRRRHLLDCLAERETPTSLTDLAEDVAARERDSSVTEASTAAADQIALSLHHVHVPRMEDAGLVEYDREDDLVALSDDGRAVTEVHGL